VKGSAYESNLSPHHDHLVCRRCGTVIEFEDREIENLQNLVTRRHGFHPTAHRLEIYGSAGNALPATPRSGFDELGEGSHRDVGRRDPGGKPERRKSVVFGTLTGRYVNVSNYPGTTVEITRGEARPGTTLEVIDTPGCTPCCPCRRTSG